MTARPEFTKADTERFLTEERNWGRWGHDDQVGAVNLITADKRVEAAGLVRSGRSISLSRPFPKEPGPGNPKPAQHFMTRVDREPTGACGDYYGVSYHGTASTHIDALCHIWDEDGIYNGRDPGDVITYSGATFGGIQNWQNGIVTRGVLIDIPAHRGEPYVTHDRPVHGWELEEACAAQGTPVRPGDAVAVYSGREAYSRETGAPWSAGTASTPGQFAADRPGLHASCLEFLRRTDTAVLVWDMMDLYPNPVGTKWSVHGAIFAFGIALVDNALLEPLAQLCNEEQRHEFMFIAAPLPVDGGTGSPLNPLALL